MEQLSIQTNFSVASPSSKSNQARITKRTDSAGLGATMKLPSLAFFALTVLNDAQYLARMKNHLHFAALIAYTQEGEKKVMPQRSSF